MTYSCSHQDGAASGPELMQSFLSVSLGSISVDAGAGVTFVVKEVFQSICTFLGFHKHQSQRVLSCVAGNKEDETKGGEQDKEHERRKRKENSLITGEQGYGWIVLTKREDGSRNLKLSH